MKRQTAILSEIQKVARSGTNATEIVRQKETEIEETKREAERLKAAMQQPASPEEPLEAEDTHS